MLDTVFIWDLPEDPEGNLQHIAEHGLTVDEVESVFTAKDTQTTTSQSSGYPITFGTTHTGRYVAVVWDRVDEDPLTVRPVTAYEPTRRRSRDRRMRPYPRE